jgi:uncharacterized protein YndB with AHSA1/START domain
MEQKTTINAEAGKQEILITREFDLPVELVFRAHVESEFFEQWMSHEYATTRVVKFESKKDGSWEFETIDMSGNKVFGAHGVIHEFKPNQKITRTFEMDNGPFGVQLELLQFEKLTDDTSKLIIHQIYESVAQRDQLLKLPFAQGLNMAHNRLQETVNKLKRQSVN